MADRMLLISWGQVVRGREMHATEVFNETLGLYGRMQQDGRIESFDVTLLRPHGGMEGYIELHGSAAQIAAVQDDGEFLAMLADAQMIVDDIRTVEGYTGDQIARMMTIYGEASSKVPQMA